jgi:hypothetical protein
LKLFAGWEEEAYANQYQITTKDEDGNEKQPVEIKVEGVPRYSFQIVPNTGGGRACRQ